MQLAKSRHAEPRAVPSDAAGGWSPARNAAIDAAIALLCILPLLLTAHLPLTDLPNHLARQYILRDWSTSSLFQQFYYIRWALVPNLALEIFVLVARQVMSIDLAVRAFCIVTILLLLLGTRQVNRAFGGGTSRTYRVAPLLCYGGPFQYGFMSYCFGIGLALVLFGLWLKLRARPVALRAIFLLASGFALMLCHLAAYGLFAVAVGICELTDASAVSLMRPLTGLRRVLLPIAALVPVFLLFLWLSPTADTATANAIDFSTVHEKLRSLLSITFFTSPRLEGVLLLLAVGGLAAALLTRTVRFHSTGLLIVLVMTTLWLAAPNIAMGASFIDYRFPWAISFFLLASLVPAARYASWATPFATGFGVLVAGRIALIAALWLSWEPTLAAIDQALSRLPLGSRVMVIEGQPASGVPFREPDLANVASYVVARRQAFEPAMFASIAGQILHFQPHYLALRQQGGFAVAIPSSLDHLGPDYDYVLDLLPNLAHIAPGLPLACAASGPDFAILKVVPAGSGSAEARPGLCPGSKESGPS